jgi:hypothetical protein
VAKKANLLKQAQPVCDAFEISKRQSTLPASLYLMQLRQQPLKIAPPKRALKIDVEMQTEVFQFVKIIRPA